MNLRVLQYLSVIIPGKWIAGDYWLKIPPLRKAVLAICLLGKGIISPVEIREKITIVDNFIKELLSSGNSASFFKTSQIKRTGDPDTQKAVGLERSLLKKILDKLNDYHVPNRTYHKNMKACLLDAASEATERYFSLDELVALDKKIKRHASKIHKNRELVFSAEGIKKLEKFIPAGSQENPVPESYIRHFFPSFKTNEFVKNHIPFKRGDKKLFSPGEVTGITGFLAKKLFARNPVNKTHMAVSTAKKWLLTAAVIFYLIPFCFDAVMLLYGTFKNEYYYTFFNRSGEIISIDTPYARRSNKIFAMNKGSNFDNFSINNPHSTVPTGALPTWSNRFSGEPEGSGHELAIELNYNKYKAARIEDQSGLTVISLEEKKLLALKTVDNHKYKEFLEAVIDKKTLEKIWYSRSSRSGSLYDHADLPLEEIHQAILSKIKKSPAPLELIQSLNNIYSVISVLYHKPNTRKWIPLDEVPPLMIEAIILREDGRFRNDLFPIPHRGNDNLVIIPQAAKKFLAAVLRKVNALAKQYEFSSIEKDCTIYLEYLKRESINDMRGGSSLSNQVVEMLYTRYIPALARGNASMARKIEQKKYELPASSMLHWFWSEDDILEAYINEIYGGHIYSHIRGFHSQSEIYFSKSLHDLNLRELVMLVGAGKKPSWIKEYAYWLKAKELQALVKNNGSIESWEKNNARYSVNRKNYTEILSSRKKIRNWIVNRTNGILQLLHSAGHISDTELADARLQQKISFNFARAKMLDYKSLVYNIQKELDTELGPGRSDSGVVMVSTIDISMQNKLQAIIDRESQMHYVAPEDRVLHQPGMIRIEGGSRVIKANTYISPGKISIINNIIADVGGSSKYDDEWDWVSQANRSLGSSLKPLLDLYFILQGYHLNDRLMNSKIIYNNYTLEQQRTYLNFIHKYPKKIKEFTGIEKNWFWIPRNFRSYTNDWVTVNDALVKSINGVHVQIQEIVGVDNFARFLNETMNIVDPVMRHKPYRSIILGGSGGDQRYDKYLLAFSIFANNGIIRQHTYIKTLQLANGSLVKAAYKPIRSSILEKYPKEYLEAACLLINKALRETVNHGSMVAMNRIGAGKTGTSNDLKDALATTHFLYGSDTYIAGIRLGNKKNYSIGKAAHEIAAPTLKRIVNSLFNDEKLLKGDPYDNYLSTLLNANPHIISIKGNYFLKKNIQDKKTASFHSEKLSVKKIRGKLRSEVLIQANKYFNNKEYELAADSYERFLKLSSSFDSNYPAFHNIIRCYIKLNKIPRVKQIIERFALPWQMKKIAAAYEKKNSITLNIDKRLSQKPYSRHRFLARERREPLLEEGKKGEGEKEEKEEEGKNDNTASSGEAGKKKDRKSKLIDYAVNFFKEWNEKQNQGNNAGSKEKNRNSKPPGTDPNK
ncbi:MAG: penicillin-binding protein [bacterium]|nr:penicillin-binding protein [bacterium]